MMEDKKMRCIVDSIEEPEFNIGLALQKMEQIYKDLFRAGLWSPSRIQITNNQEYFFYLIDKLLKTQIYDSKIQSFFQKVGDSSVIPALNFVRYITTNAYHEYSNKEYVKNSIVFLCKSLMRHRYNFLEFSKLLSCYSSIVKVNEYDSGKIDWIYDLILSDPIISKDLILSIPSSLQYNGKHENISASLTLLETLITTRSNCFDIDTIDYIVKALHNSIINASNVTLQLKSQTINLMIMLDQLCYEKGDICLSASMDKFFQFMITERVLSMELYFSTVFSNKEPSWIENSLLSLEVMMFPDISVWANDEDDVETNWSEVVLFLEMYQLIMNNETIRISFEDTAYKCVKRLMNPMVIPDEYEIRIKVLLCLIGLDPTYSKTGYVDLKNYFMHLHSYFVFTTSQELKLKAFTSMMHTIELYPEELSIGFEVSTNDNECLSELKICLQHHMSNNCTELYFPYNKYLEKHFIFDELFFQLYKFENIDNVSKLISSISDTPQRFRKTCETAASKYRLKGWNIELRHGILHFLFKRVHRAYEHSKHRLTPKYPAPSEKVVRHYLFLLLNNPNKKILDRSFDIAFLDSFRYDKPDIIWAFGKVFETYTIPESFIVAIIDKLADQDCILLKIVNMNSSLKSTILTYEHRFKILHACVTGNPEYHDLFRKLFINIENDEIDYTIPTTNSKSPYFVLLRTMEFLYVTWESYERSLFWEYLTECAYINFDFENLIVDISLFVESLTTNRFVYVDRKLILPLTQGDVKLNNSQFKTLIVSKIKLRNSRIEFRKAVENSQSIKKIQTLNSRPKKNQEDDTEILKIKELEISSDEKREVTIKVYPNGLIVKEDSERLKKKELQSLKNLSPAERKMLFKIELMSTKSSDNYKERVVEMSFFVRQRIAIDIFKGVIKGNHHIGLLVGFLFKTTVDFSAASDEEIMYILTDFKLDRNDLTLRLYWWFANYLTQRGLLNVSISDKIEKVRHLLRVAN